MNRATSSTLKLLGLTAFLITAITHASNAPANVLSAQIESLCGSAGSERSGSLVQIAADAKSLRVVAIGSSSTQGAGASRPAYSYVSQLGARLNAVWPSHTEVINRGVGGDRLSDIVARAPQDLYALHPNLVILQTGMNDALQGVPVAEYKNQLLHFVREIRARQIPVILVDNQYLPAKVGTAEYEAIQGATHDVASATGSALVSRYGLSLTLQTRAHLSASALLSDDGLHPNDVMHACTASALAVSIEKLSASAHRVVAVNVLRSKTAL
jgi:acyl-CoA thioesterase I